MVLEAEKQRKKPAAKPNRKKRAAKSTNENTKKSSQSTTQLIKELLRSNFIRYTFSIIAITLGILSLLALVSFHPDDPSLNSGSVAAHVHNWAGLLGSYIADGLFQVFGITAYILPLLLIAKGMQSIFHIGNKVNMLQRFGFILALACVTATIHLLTKAQIYSSFNPGGLLGTLVGGFLSAYLAKAGSLIVLFGSLAISVYLVFGETLGKLWHNLTMLCMQMGKLFGQIFARIYNNFKDNMESLLEYDQSSGLTPVASGDESDLSDPSLRVPLQVQEKVSRKQEKKKEYEQESKAALQQVSHQELWPHKNIPAQQDAPVFPPIIVNAEDEQVQGYRPNSHEAAVWDRVEPAFELGDEIDLIEEQSFELGDFNLENSDAIKREKINDNNDSMDQKDGDASESEMYVHGIQAADGAEESEEEIDDMEVYAQTETKEALALDTPKRVLSAENEYPEPIPEIIEFKRSPANEEIEKSAHKLEKSLKKENREYELPPISFLDYEAPSDVQVDKDKLQENADRLVETLKSFAIKGHIREIRLGPVVTMYEFVPAPGTKLSKITALADDIAMSMSALRVRIVAPLPGKGAVGIEIPNEERQMVYLKEVIASKEFQKTKSPTTLSLGKDIDGTPIAADLRKMPHLLIAGATGTGKSVAINAMLTSILYKANPDDIKMIMVDPKQLELAMYEGIPHLLLPVVTDPRKAAQALRWAVDEMERRYTILAEMGVRDIQGYNKKRKKIPETERFLKDGSAMEHMPFIVILIDEFADLMMVASREVETYVARLAQKARAAGIHLILATQRPSVDVITGVIKANFPTRISFQVASKHDSRTILDTVGAEHLLGKGDMLFMPPGSFGLKRVHGALVTEREIEQVVEYLKEQGTPEYDESILATISEEGGENSDEPVDEMYDLALEFIAKKRKCSISLIQRQLRIGYNRAARIVEQMEAEGVVGPSDGSKPREVLVPPPAPDA